MTRLRAAPEHAWSTIEAPLGAHDGTAIDAALAGLQRDGLIERDGAGRARLRAS